MKSYLYVEPGLRSFGVFGDDRLPAFTERHPFQMPILALIPTGSLRRDIAQPPVAGVVFGMWAGLPGKDVLRLAGYALRRGRVAFLYWPAETAIEVVDRERLGSLWRHWLAYNAGRRLASVLRRVRARRGKPPGPPQGLPTAEFGEPARASLEFIVADFESTKAHLLGAVGEVRRLAAMAAPVEASLGALRNSAVAEAGNRADFARAF